MATAQDLRDIAESCPWDRADFRAGLSALSGSTERAAQQFAADVRQLAALVAMVPRCPGDERGGTPWTSFRREVAVARQVADPAASALIRTAVSLTTTMPVMLGLLEAGEATVDRAAAFARELAPYDDELVRRVDADIAARVAKQPLWRIAHDVRRAVQVHDPEAGAQRVSVKNAARGVLLQADADDQAAVTVFGPAVPLTRCYTTLDERARALKQAGDPRGLDALRFDLATSTFPCAVHAPADQGQPGAVPGDPIVGDLLARQHGDAAAGLRPSFVAAAPTDCRASRPVQASIAVPVETALGLSNEPGWLDGYGWISAPTSRLLLVDAELRKVCVQSGTGELLDVAGRAVRPPPTPAGVRAGLLDMVLDDATLSGVGDRVESDHDPSEPLRRFVVVRDRGDDGPTGTRTPAGSCHLDHDTPHPAGPTAAWNLVARADRTHQLKHFGWIPLRTPTTTVWTTPSGQLVTVLRHTAAPPGVDAGPGAARLPDADELDLLDRGQLEAPDDEPPWLHHEERDTTEWSWLEDDDAA